MVQTQARNITLTAEMGTADPIVTAWESIRASLRRDCGARTFDGWLRPIALGGFDSDGGTLRLTVDIEDDALLIQVADDGSGCKSGAWSAAPGLGLQAVRRQLHAQFGSDARCEIDSSPGAGFIVDLVLPARLPRRVAR